MLQALKKLCSPKLRSLAAPHSPSPAPCVPRLVFPVLAGLSGFGCAHACSAPGCDGSMAAGGVGGRWGGRAIIFRSSSHPYPYPQLSTMSPGASAWVPAPKGSPQDRGGVPSSGITTASLSEGCLRSGPACETITVVLGPRVSLRVVQSHPPVGC